MSKILSDNPNIRILTDDVFSKTEDEKLREYRRKWQENPEYHVVEKFPIHLDIESTSICNLKCPFCAGTYEKYSYGMMSMDLYRKIIDEGGSKGLYSVKLNFRGEPLLHPQVADMVAYAKNKGIVDVFFNTNGTLLTEAAGQKLIEAGLDRLIVSFEGYTKEVYEKNRVGAVFEEVVRNVRNFSAMKRSMKRDKPALRLQTVEITNDPDYLRTYKAFWHEYADEITCIDLRDEIADYSCLDASGWECAYPWRRLCITWDGGVLTCPFVNKADGKYQWQGLGSAARDSVEEIWNGPEMRRIRESHRQGAAHTIEPCKYCSYRGTEIMKEKKRLDR